VLRAGGELRLSAKLPIVSARERPELILTAPIFLDNINLLGFGDDNKGGNFGETCQYFDIVGGISADKSSQSVFSYQVAIIR
jgi:hypothetical protein